MQVYFVICAWILDHLNVAYLYKKRSVFYFSKRVPCDVNFYYRSECAFVCHKTKLNVWAFDACELRSFISKNFFSNTFKCTLLHITSAINV